MYSMGQNTRLDIIPTDEPFHYYLIFYKASLPLPGKHHRLQQPEQLLPFHLQYGFVPYHPAILYELAERMHGEWNIPGRLGRLHTRTLFYQFVYELLRQMDQQQVSATRPDLASQLMRYMHEHYAQPLTRETLARTFHYSVPYLSKYFRRVTGASIIDYLIVIRMDKAGTLLQKTELSLQEVAASVGYADVSYFIRLFKKHTGVTPKQFKYESGQVTRGSYRPILRLRSSIAPANSVVIVISEMIIIIN
ncbi:helix-turn-helix domain-containing protein [Paenibacillus amylolyticus]|nr:helix-turn-helix domain-containing protein [Paenibacillus amylolyticus]WFR65129.1 helix-turn-helix domain-containing protein [Paenibacillus amylolyticus]